MSVALGGAASQVFGSLFTWLFSAALGAFAADLSNILFGRRETGLLDFGNNNIVEPIFLPPTPISIGSLTDELALDNSYKAQVYDDNMTALSGVVYSSYQTFSTVKYIPTLSYISNAQSFPAVTSTSNVMNVSEVTASSSFCANPEMNCYNRNFGLNGLENEAWQKFGHWMMIAGGMYMFYQLRPSLELVEEGVP